MSILHILLFPFAMAYNLITWVRNKFFDLGILKTHRCDVLVVCVGNLRTGGTGKSPHVRYIAELLKLDKTVAIISRGYGRKTKGFLEVTTTGKAEDFGDEPLELKNALPEIPVVVDEDRVHGVETLLKIHPEVEVVIMDDGFQHRRIHQDLKIVLTTFHSPFTKDYLLPMGNLRESRSSARRADLVLLTKIPHDVGINEQAVLKRNIGEYTNASVHGSQMEYGELVPVFRKDGEHKSLEGIEPCILMTGIANPDQLVEQVASKTEILKHIVYPDHHDPSRKELEFARYKFDNFAELEPIIITTKKDAMRLRSSSNKEVIQELPVYYLEMTVRPLDEAEFKRSLLQHVR